MVRKQFVAASYHYPLGLSMEDYEKFQEAILKAAQYNIRPLMEENRDELNKVVENHLFNKTGPTSVNRKLSQEEVIFGKVFKGFTEISDTFNCLKDIEIYIGRFPYSGTKISKTRHLQYNFENYLHEIYILKERLIKYLTTVGRLYKKDLRHQEVLKATKPIFKIASGTLSQVTNVRSSHVHQRRYDDENFQRLSTFELLKNNSKEDNLYSESYDMEYRVTRKKLKNTILKNNKEIKLLLNEYFKRLYPVLFDCEKELLYPKNKL